MFSNDFSSGKELILVHTCVVPIMINNGVMYIISVDYLPRYVSLENIQAIRNSVRDFI